MSKFNPTAAALDTIQALRGKCSSGHRDDVLAMLKGHREYLRAVAHGDRDLPGHLPDGTTVYYAWQAVSEALWYSEIESYAAGCLDGENDFQMDWAKRLKELSAECRKPAVA